MVVLSNNDGCVVARSPEAKALGLKTGTPEQVADAGRRIRQAVQQHLGLPVCVGIAPTKTLAKFANHVAKNNPRDHRIGGVFSVVLERTVLELGGTACVPDVDEHAGPAQVILSRSFSRPVSTEAEMDDVMNVYAQRAAARLAVQDQQARMFTVAAGTSRFAGPDGSVSRAAALAHATADPITITRSAVAAMRSVITEGVPYTRDGVMLTGLEPAGTAQDMLSGFGNQEPDRHLEEVLERVRGRSGGTSIGLGQGGLTEQGSWTMRREFALSQYTTRFADLPLVRA